MAVTLAVTFGLMSLTLLFLVISCRNEKEELIRKQQTDLSRLELSSFNAGWDAGVAWSRDQNVVTEQIN